jgi:ATP-binding cassette subfamily B protein
VTSLLSLAPLAAKAAESVRSLAEVLQDPDVELNAGRQTVEGVEGHIRFADVSFAYPGAAKGALVGIELDIPAGTTTAFVGASGAGKSTLLNLVLGFLRPDEGRLEIDGRPMGDLDLRSVRRHVSVVPQESVLFEGSVRDNVTYGLGEVADSRVYAALEGANALEFVADMPEGLGTVVGERGARLSGGQRQRLSIARALIRNPRILLLDEATSALDSESEAKVREALGALLAGRTSLVVAHRLSTVRAADLIVVLEGGRIVERGTHGELIDRKGVYARMHALQSF